MMKLYGYWRSSSSYRVRIALALKAIEVTHIPVNLREGAQRSDMHRARNPQGFVPVLELDDGMQLTQSLAIIDYVDRAFPETKLIPVDPIKRARVMAASLVIATDIQPIQNLAVLKYLRAELGQGDKAINSWAHDWIFEGLSSLESILKQQCAGPFFMGNAPGLFECCLIPQVYNAGRFGVDMSAFPILQAIDKAASTIPEFMEAAPENQIDAIS